MKDIIVQAALVLAFALLVTVHIAIAARLTLHARPRWRGLVALVVPPLAPLWGLQEGFRRTAILWLVAVLVYAAAVIAAYI